MYQCAVRYDQSVPHMYTQAGHDEVLGQINDASEPHAPIEEENAVGNCVIPSNSSRIIVGDSVYVNERDCKVCLLSLYLGVISFSWLPLFIGIEDGSK